MLWIVCESCRNVRNGNAMECSKVGHWSIFNKWYGIWWFVCAWTQHTACYSTNNVQIDNFDDRNSPLHSVSTIQLVCYRHTFFMTRCHFHHNDEQNFFELVGPSSCCVRVLFEIMKWPAIRSREDCIFVFWLDTFITFSQWSLLYFFKGHSFV